MKLYEYAVIYNPTDKAKKDGAVASVIVPITSILAAEESQAQILAARAIPDEYLDKLDQVEIAIRPF